MPDEKQRYIPIDEGGGNERCENCFERASAHFCLPMDAVPKSTLTAERHRREQAEREVERLREALTALVAANGLPHGKRSETELTQQVKRRAVADALADARAALATPRGLEDPCH